MPSDDENCGLELMLGARRSWEARLRLDRWTKSPGEIELPILQHHSSDEEIREIIAFEDAYTMYRVILGEPCRSIIFSDITEYLRTMLAEAVRLCEQAYGLKLDFPGVSMYNASTSW